MINKSKNKQIEGKNNKSSNGDKTLQTYVFPTLGLVIKASSREAARKMLERRLEGNDEQ